MLRARGRTPTAVGTIVATIYGPPGLGKSTLGLAARNPLVIDCDNGSYRSALYDPDRVVEAEQWKDVADISSDIDYDTLVLDTAGAAVDWIIRDVIARNPKHGRGGVISGFQGWGLVRQAFYGFMDQVFAAKKDIVLLVHSEEKDNYGSLVERLRVQGSAQNLIKEKSTMMGLLMVTNEGRRAVDFRPTAASHGKDPVGLGRVFLPETAEETKGFTADLIDMVRGRINERLGVKQLSTEERELVASELNELVARAQENGEKATGVKERVREYGLEWDASAKEFRLQ